MDSRGPVITTYIDSSALVRFIAREGEIETIQEALSGQPVTSGVARVEVFSALYQRFRGGAISERYLRLLLNIAERTVFVPITLVHVGDDTLSEARELVSTYSLRALDAVHLGTAAVVERRSRRGGDLLYFCTADRRQAEVAIEVFGEHRVAFVPPLSTEQT